MAEIEITSPVMTEEAGQAIASAISTMSSTSVGNLSALTTTDKTSLVGAVNEVKSGLTVTTTAYNNVTVNAGSRQWLGNILHRNKMCIGYCDDSNIVVYIASLAGGDALQVYAYNPTANAITANMGVNILG